MIGALQFGGGCMGLTGFAMEEAVGQGPTDALMEKDEEEGDADAFVGEAVGIMRAVSFQ